MRLRTLFGLMGALLSVALSAPASAQTTFTDSFARANGPLGNGWTTTGSIAIGGNQAVAGGDANFSTAFRPASEVEMNGAASVRTVVNSGGESHDLYLRVQGSGLCYRLYVVPALGTNAGTTGVFTGTGPTAAAYIGGGVNWQATAGHLYLYQFAASGTSPTTLTETITDQGTDGGGTTVVASATLTDSTAGIQQAGSSGFAAQNTSGTVGIYDFAYTVTGIVQASPYSLDSLPDASALWSKDWAANSDGSRVTPYPGATLKGTFSGTSFGLKVDTGALAAASVAAANYPNLMASIDGGAWQVMPEPATGTDMIFASGTLAAGPHTFEVLVQNMYELADAWDGAGEVKVTGLYTDGGAALGAYTARPNTAGFWLDSIGEGVDTRSFAPNQAGNDASVSWVRAVADTLNAEASVFGVSGIGWTNPGQRSFPTFPAAFGRVDAAHAAGLTGLTYAFINMGENDFIAGASDSTVSADVSAGLVSARAACGPSTRIFILVPFSQHEQAAVTAGYNTYQSAHHDAKCYLLPATALTARGIVRSPLNVPNAYSWDSVHPKADDEATLAASTIKGVQSALTPATTRPSGATPKGGH